MKRKAEDKKELHERKRGKVEFARGEGGRKETAEPTEWNTSKGSSENANLGGLLKTEKSSLPW